MPAASRWKSFSTASDSRILRVFWRIGTLMYLCYLLLWACAAILLLHTRIKTCISLAGQIFQWLNAIVAQRLVYDPLGPLDRSRNETRLLIIQPTTNENALITCNMIRVSLDDEVTYSALSYVWGLGEATKMIQINGAPFFVKPNLLSVLRRLRLDDQVTPVWIDALCINQADIAERSFQVAIMGTIYGKAKMVTAWLGEASGDSNLAFELLQNAWDVSVRNRNSEKIINLVRLPAYENHWRAIQRLISLQYWERVWICQELILSRRALLVSGPLCFSWYNFVDLLHAVVSWPNLPSAGFRKAASDAIRDITFSQAFKLAKVSQSRRRGFVPALFTTLVLGRSRKATDLRDHVYGLLSIATKHHGMQVDYSKDIRQVYKDSTIACLKSASNAKILTACKLLDTTTGMPSWVPNWSYRLREDSYVNPEFSVEDISYPDFTAGGEAFGGFLLEDGDRTLVVDGFILDKVYSTNFPNVEPHEKQVSNDVLHEWWSMWTSFRESSRASKYGDEQKQLLAFARTIVVGKYSRRSEGQPEEFETDSWQSYWRLALKWHPTTHKSPAAFKDIDSVNPAAAVFKMQSLRTRIYAGLLAAPKFFITVGGRMGRGSMQARPGDEVGLILGAPTPFILRPTENNRYLIVGECYVDGIMDGEALEETTRQSASSRRLRLG
ncbi:heterokaryon incompatibility protein-domain-containing protein [Lineolata rhizophorae]|uniref:Heterokaryon incompatibility protein-domain-containing protein n=1 Tax=Lineolata rhizophorae TaxID=578093 RepID=A0A6A6P9Y2_9PEZI|nr:heterokaryon incompatibility protein-domain-containing protein [Lineolata rhizophorae]